MLLLNSLFISCNRIYERPNVIIIITDDQGYGDIGYNGNKIISTPNIDHLAQQSIRFNNFYPDGTKNKNLNSNKIKALGWKPKIKLEAGIQKILDQKKFRNE